jgi:Protein of unknown function (DUF3611)
MQTSAIAPNRERIATVLKLVGWLGFWLQLALAGASSLMLAFAITGRSFNRAAAPLPGVGVGTYSQATTPGLGIGIFWGIWGVVALLFAVYLFFRLTRFSKSLQDPNSHVKKVDVFDALRLTVIVSLAGMLLTILGGGATLGVLLAKAIAQPQGVAIYDPSRIIRSLDIFVAMANMNGIAAHFIGTATSLGLLRWLFSDGLSVNSNQ